MQNGKPKQLKQSTEYPLTITTLSRLSTHTHTNLTGSDYMCNSTIIIQEATYPRLYNILFINIRFRSLYGWLVFRCITAATGEDRECLLEALNTGLRQLNVGRDDRSVNRRLLGCTVGYLGHVRLVCQVLCSSAVTDNLWQWRTNVLTLIAIIDRLYTLLLIVDCRLVTIFVRNRFGERRRGKEKLSDKLVL